MQQMVRRILQMREGEARRLLPLLSLMFLTLTTLLLIKPAAGSLFLAELGSDQLPLAFVGVAITAGMTTLLFSVLTRRYRLTVLLQITFLISIAVLSVFAVFVLPGGGGGYLMYILYIWCNLFGLIAVSQIYLLAGELFDLREAKRLFNLIGLAAIVGAIFGGYLTSVLASFLSVSQLLGVAVALSVISIILCGMLAPHAVHPDYEASTKGLAAVWQEVKYPYQYIRQSRYLQLVVLMTGLGVMIAKLVEYQYSSLALEVYTDVEELTAFFGFWLSTISVLSLGVQVFLTQRAIKQLGVSRTLQILPQALMVATVVLLVFPVLWAAVLARVFDGGLKQSLHKSSFELLLLPIPSQEKKASKTFIDVFVDSLATGLSGLVLLFLVARYGLPTRDVAFLTAVLLIGWLVVGRQLGREYLNAFRLRLSRRAKKEEDMDVKWNERAVLEGLSKVLRRGGESQILYVLGKLQTVPPQLIFEQPLLILLSHHTPAVRAAAVATLAHYESVDIEDKTEEMLAYDPAPEVKVQALFYLARRRAQSNLKGLKRYLDAPDPTLADAALLALLAETRGNKVLWKKLQLGSRLKEVIQQVSGLPAGEERDQRQLVAMKAIGIARKAKYYPQLIEWLSEADGELRSAVFQAIAKAHHPIFLPVLFDEVHGSNRAAAIKAIASYDDVTLLAYLEKNQEAWHGNLRTMRLLPKILTQVPSLRVLEYLLHLLEYPDQVVRDEALLALYTIQEQQPRLHFNKRLLQERLLAETELFSRMLSLLYAQLEQLPEDESPVSAARKALIRVLEKRLDRNLERIFRLLGLRYSSVDYLQIYDNLRSREADRRDNALEFLENLLEPSLKDQILPIAEIAATELLPSVAPQSLQLRPLDERKAYVELLSLQDHRLALSVLYLFRTIGDPSNAELVRSLLNSPHPAVRDYAAETLRLLDKELK